MNGVNATRNLKLYLLIFSVSSCAFQIFLLLLESVEPKYLDRGLNNLTKWLLP